MKVDGECLKTMDFIIFCCEDLAMLLESYELYPTKREIFELAD